MKYHYFQVFYLFYACLISGWIWKSYWREWGNRSTNCCYYFAL